MELWMDRRREGRMEGMEIDGITLLKCHKKCINCCVIFYISSYVVLIYDFYFLSLLSNKLLLLSVTEEAYSSGSVSSVCMLNLNMQM